MVPRQHVPSRVNEAFGNEDRFARSQILDADLERVGHLLVAESPEGFRAA
jgi:hypothetical protein